MIEKYTFELHAPGVQEKLVLVKSDLEKRTHIALKLLSYLLFYDSRLKIEGDVEMHYKPDLVVTGEHGVPELWIDCGKVAVRKIESLTAKLKHTRIIFVKESRNELIQFKRLLEKKLENSRRVQYLAFESDFVRNLSEAFQRTNHLTLYEIMTDVIGVALNDQIFESTLYH